MACKANSTLLFRAPARPVYVAEPSVADAGLCIASLYIKLASRHGKQGVISLPLFRGRIADIRPPASCRLNGNHRGCLCTGLPLIKVMILHLSAGSFRGGCVELIIFVHIPPQISILRYLRSITKYLLSSFPSSTFARPVLVVVFTL
jgi:hypothetical protein